jgi:hypothetical protein
MSGLVEIKQQVPPTPSTRTCILADTFVAFSFFLGGVLLVYETDSDIFLFLMVWCVCVCEGAFSIVLALFLACLCRHKCLVLYESVSNVVLGGSVVEPKRSGSSLCRNNDVLIYS